ncbi:MAG: DUF721 domain-containing protein [Bacteroidales bacterium]|nr:DUF721 domain-containing protein [Bacteroidales bacterium]
MAPEFDNIRFTRKEALTMEEVVSRYIKSMKLAAGLNTHKIYEAWDACSGAARFTLKRFFRSGKLYITLSSSVVRNQLYFQRDLLVEKINAYLSSDPLFTPDNRSVSFVQEIVLK